MTAESAQKSIQIGDLDDGGVYVGLSAENGKPLHVALADLSEYKTFDEALAAAEQLKAAHPTAHVPTPKELDKNFLGNWNRGHLKGTFAFCSSSRPYMNSNSCIQYLAYGDQYRLYKSNRASVRLVW